MINHHNIFLPNFLYPFLNVKIGFSSIIDRSYNGKDFVKNQYNQADRIYYIRSCKLSNSQLNEFLEFYNLRCGSLYSFLIDDYSDNQLDSSYIGESDGVSTDFQIYKNISDEFSSQSQRIYFIDERDAELRLETGEEVRFKFDCENSTLKIETPIEEGQKIYLSCKYYKIVRFLSKEIEYNKCFDNSYELSNIEMRQII